MTQSNNPSEGFEEHKPSGKKSKGPSMKERLMAQRRAEAEAAAAGGAKAEAPAPKKAAAPKKAVAKKAPAKKAAAKPVKRAAAASASEGDAPAPKRASGARRPSGGSRASSSRRRGGDDGDAEETGGRRGRSKPPQKNMTPIFGGIAVVVIGAAAYFFTQGGGEDKPTNAQEQTAAAEAEAAKAKADEAAAETQRLADADAAAAAAAADAEKAKADKAKADAAAAEAAKPKEPEGPLTEAPRNKKGKQKIMAGEKYADSLYDPNDAAEPQIATFDLFGRPDDCSESDWEKIESKAAMLADLESGAAGTRAAQSLKKDYGKNAVPALINVLLRLDYTTQEGQESGDFVQRTLSGICNGRNADWRYGFDIEPNKTIILNRRTVNVWYGVWAKVVEDPTYWDRFAGQTEAAKRAKKGPAEPEPENDTENLDDLLDDL